jgi:hypothetical protein
MQFLRNNVLQRLQKDSVEVTEVERYAKESNKNGFSYVVEKQSTR